MQHNTLRLNLALSILFAQVLQERNNKARSASTGHEEDVLERGEVGTAAIGSIDQDWCRVRGQIEELLSDPAGNIGLEDDGHGSCVLLHDIHLISGLHRRDLVKVLTSGLAVLQTV
jgi:hypothetical protein